MSALCCAAPGLAGAPNGNGSASQSVYYPFARSSYSYIELNPYAAAAAAAAAAMETASRQTSLHYQQPSFAVQHHQQPQQQQLQQQQQQQQQQIRRRKRLEHAVTETIPSASSGKVSQRIAQLQQSLTSQSVQQQRAHPLLPASSAPRPLSLDAGKDYSQPLTVDCSIEYDLPRVARPPPGAEPLLLIAPRREVVVRPSPQQQQQQQQHWSGPLSQPFVPCAYMTDGAPVSSCSSDSGRGTDTERTSSPAFNQFNGSWMQPPASWMGAGQRVKVNYHKSALPVHPRPADAVRSQRNAEPPACPCCPPRANGPVQRWAPYTTTTARHACPAPSALQQQQSSVYGNEQQQQQQQTYGWARWNQQHDQSLAYLHGGGSSSLMAFHV